MTGSTNRKLQAELEAARRRIAELERDEVADVGVDWLSGLRDLHSFCLAADVELRRAMRHERPIALALINVDGMAEINERHGRPAGDGALAEVGRVLAMFLREHDLACRAWADEFALLLPETGEDGATACCERILLELSATSTGPVPALSASAGVVAFDGGSSLFELVALASGALREARSEGTGRIAVSRRSAAPWADR